MNAQYDQEPSALVDMANRADVDAAFAGRYRRTNAASMKGDILELGDPFAMLTAGKNENSEMKFRSRDRLPKEMQVEYAASKTVEAKNIDFKPESSQVARLDSGETKVAPRAADLKSLSLAELQALYERISRAQAEARSQVPAGAERVDLLR